LEAGRRRRRGFAHIGESRGRRRRPRDGAPGGGSPCDRRGARPTATNWRRPLPAS